MASPRLERVMTDNHLSHTRSQHLAKAMTTLGANHMPIHPHCPWQNGKVERYNRTLQTEQAYRQAYLNNTHRLDTHTPWVEHYNTQRRHPAIEGQPPTTRLS